MSGMVSENISLPGATAKANDELRPIVSMPIVDMEEAHQLTALLPAWRENRRWAADSDTVEKLWPLIEAHGLGALVGDMTDRDLITASPISALARHRQMGDLMRHERAMKGIEKIGETIERENILAVIMKGPAMVEQGYGGEAIRPYGDIDIFIPTEEEGWRFVKALDGVENAFAKDSVGLLSRFREAGKIEATWEGQTLEIMFPLDEASDPLTAVLGRNRDRLFGHRDGYARRLLDPDPSVHFLFLIAHMVTHHLCARLIWWLDLVAIRDRQDLDFEWISEELADMELLKVGQALTSFLRHYIDPDFPHLGDGKENSDDLFLIAMTDPVVIANRSLGPQYVSRKKQLILYPLLYVVLFYLLSDNRGRKPDSVATGWMTRHFVDALGVRSRVLTSLISSLCRYLIVPSASVIQKFMFSSTRFAYWH